VRIQGAADLPIAEAQQQGLLALHHVLTTKLRKTNFLIQHKGLVLVNNAADAYTAAAFIEQHSGQFQLPTGAGNYTRVHAMLQQVS
jgi:hypothetical protein